MQPFKAINVDARGLDRMTFRIVASLLAVGAFAFPKDEEIGGLPGFPRLETPQFSGSVDLADGSSARYVLVLGPSGFKAVDRPLLLWVGDGRGSSLPGYLSSGVGPWKVGADGALTTNNVDGWHVTADLLFWELPAGAGFSTCPAAGCPTYTDTSFEAQSTEFLCEFFKKFPEFEGSDFFMAGEGLGGVAVPLAALGYADVTCPAPAPKLVGVAVGNACTGTEVGPCSPSRAYNTFHQLNEHDFVSPATVDAVTKYCAGSEGFTQADLLCQKAVRAASAEAGKFNLLDARSRCGQDATLEKFVCRHTPNATWACISKDTTPDFSCGRDAALEAYLSRSDVQKALGVAPVDGKAVAWTAAYDEGAYVATAADLLLPSARSYPALIERIGRVMVFAGDGDAATPHSATEQWTRGLGPPPASLFYRSRVTSARRKKKLPLLRPFSKSVKSIAESLFASPEPSFDGERVHLERRDRRPRTPPPRAGLRVADAWRPWVVDDFTAGNVVSYDSNFTLVTVRNAGRHVAESAPRSAAALIRRFIAGHPITL